MLVRMINYMAMLILTDFLMSFCLLGGEIFVFITSWF